MSISYAVFCLKKKKKNKKTQLPYSKSTLLPHSVHVDLPYMFPTSLCHPYPATYVFFFFFNDTATTEIYTLSLHDALPIWRPPPSRRSWGWPGRCRSGNREAADSGVQPLRQACQ